MSTGLKVVLWIVGILGGLILIVVVAGFFVGRAVMDDAEDAMKFAANATHQDCEDELVKRIKACDGMSCMMKTAVFGGGCLSSAKGDRDEYCADVPKDAGKGDFADWRGEFCEYHELTGQKCDFSAGMIVGICSSAPKR